MKKIRAPRSHILALTIILCLCFVAVSSLLITYTYSESTRLSRQDLQGSAAQIHYALSQHIDMDFLILQGVALSFSQLDLADTPQLYALLRRINDSNPFVRMGVATTQGIATMVDLDGSLHEGIDVSREDFFLDAMAGEKVLTDMRPALLDGVLVNYYALPITSGDAVEGVLIAVSQSTLMEEIIDTKLFHGDGYSILAGESGQIVGPSIEDYTPFPHVENIHALFDSGTTTAPHASGGPVGENEFFSGYINEERYAIIIQAMGVNSWYLISFVPEKTVNEYYNRAMQATLTLVLFTVAIFLFLIFYQRRTLLKNRSELERIAYHDPITGSRNYVKFEMDANEIMASRPGNYVLWCLDIKQFKRINDMLGVGDADRLLQDIASMLRAQETPDSIYCHMMADNFAGIRPSRKGIKPGQWLESLQADINSLEVLREHRLHVEMGMGLYCTEDHPEALPIRDMVNSATIAKQFAKQRMGTSFSYYTPRMAERTRYETLLESSAPSALARGEFIFYLQPKVRIQEGLRLTGAEALVRWQSGDKLIPPSDFIPLFEHNGFIIDLDRYLFSQVCGWYAGYLAAGHPPINLAINVSRVNFLTEDFIEHYTGVKRSLGLSDGLIELELTESVVVDNIEEFREKIDQLRAAGFICSLDDFGSGYSSLNVLKNLPMDVIKLDAAFFREGKDLERERIVIRSFIHMARELKIKTVAEGVETRDQVFFLQACGCDVVQGYIFSKPLPPEAFIAFTQEEITLE